MGSPVPVAQTELTIKNLEEIKKPISETKSTFYVTHFVEIYLEYVKFNTSNYI